VISLIYLGLGSAEEAVTRVRQRVAAGGHGIPEDTIHRRFEKSLRYLETIYKPIVNEWYICESRDGTFTLVEARNEGSHESRT
jgi:predicted ABC-type ATPase